MLEPGDVLGEFEILAPISKGGMGAVYRARQASTKMLRALKVMLPEWQDDDDLRGRFKQEAQACSEVASEHVVKIVDYGVDSARNMPWIAMEYLQGRTLREHVATQQRLSIDELRSLCQQLFHGIAAAHAAGLVHRDLKPENVFIADSMRPDVPITVKVIDFGIAKVLTAVNEPTLAMGTHAWMAPEQSSARPIVDERSDVWALGLIVFWLLTGKYYWIHASGPRDSLQVEVHESPIATASRRALALGARSPGPEFDDWFARSVNRDPERRFGNAAQSWEVLSRVLTRLEQSGTAPTETPHSLPAPASPPCTEMASSDPFSSPTQTLVGAIERPARTRMRRTAVGVVAALGIGFTLWRSLADPVESAPAPLEARVVDTPTTSAVGATVSDSPEPPTKPITAAASTGKEDAPVSAPEVQIYAERPSGLVLMGASEPLLSGDTYAFFVRSKQRVYVGVYELGKDAKLKRLYPPRREDHAAARDLALAPGELTRVPPASEGDFVVDADVGVERLVFLQSSRPLMNIPSAGVARAVTGIDSWPSSWSLIATPEPVKRQAQQHTVRVRGSSFVPRRSSASPGDFVVAVTFFEIEHAD